MNPGNDIVKELQELQSPLADMPRTMPFTVPEGYFASLSVASIISDEDPVLNLPKTMPFEVPEGYFSAFSVTSIIKEAETEPVLDLPKTTPFEVPQGYFEAFEANILNKVETPFFGKVASSFEAPPADYFNNFADRMLAAAKVSDIPAQIVADKKESRVIEFKPNWKSIRWAAAAMLVLSIGVGSFMKFSGNGTQIAPFSVSKQLAQLDKGLIRSYVEQHIDEFDTELLADNSSILNMSAEKNIDKMKDQDIKQYLEDGDLGDSGVN